MHEREGLLQTMILSLLSLSLPQTGSQTHESWARWRIIHWQTKDSSCLSPITTLRIIIPCRPLLSLRIIQVLYHWFFHQHLPTTADLAMNKQRSCLYQKAYRNLLLHILLLVLLKRIRFRKHSPLWKHIFVFEAYGFQIIVVWKNMRQQMFWFSPPCCFHFAESGWKQKEEKQ